MKMLSPAHSSTPLPYMGPVTLATESEAREGLTLRQASECGLIRFVNVRFTPIGVLREEGQWTSIDGGAQ